METYDVCIVFNVLASNDDEALRTVSQALPRNRDNMAWAWIYTTLTEGESNNGTDNDTQ